MCPGRSLARLLMYVMSVSSVTSTKFFLGGRLQLRNVFKIMLHGIRPRLVKEAGEFYILAWRPHQIPENHFHPRFHLLLSVWSVCLRWSRCKTNRRYSHGGGAGQHCWASATIIFGGGCVLRKQCHLKAWMTTVPNRMNKAEKMRDSRGIISRLRGREGVTPERQVLCCVSS